MEKISVTVHFYVVHLLLIFKINLKKNIFLYTINLFKQKLIHFFLFIFPTQTQFFTRQSNSTLTFNRYTQAEARAEFAERSVQKLQKEVDRLEGMSIKDFFRLILRI